MDLHQPSGRGALGGGLAAATMLLWGLLPHGLALALAELDPVTLTWFRFGVAAALMGGWLGARGGLPRRVALAGGGGWLLLVATAGLAVNYLAYVVGLGLTTPANAQVLIQVAPLLLGLGGIFVFGELFTRAQWLSLSVLVGGIGLFFSSQLVELAAEAGRYLRGVGMIGVAAVTWAVYGLAQKQLLRRLSSQQIMLSIYVGCFAVFSAGARPAALAELSAVGWGALVFAALNTLGAYGCFAAALEHWPASRVSAVIAVTPLMTLFFGILGSRVWPALVESEVVAWTSLLGAGLVVAGSMGVSLLGRRAE